jgi:hypothetical protein
MPREGAKNQQVKEAFLHKKELKGASLTSDGKSLWSYGWWEIARWVKGKIVVRKGKSYSRTTEIFHRRGVPGVPAKQESPKDQAIMNL